MSKRDPLPSTSEALIKLGELKQRVKTLESKVHPKAMLEDFKHVEDPTDHFNTHFARVLEKAGLFGGEVDMLDFDDPLELDPVEHGTSGDEGDEDFDQVLSELTYHPNGKIDLKMWTDGHSTRAGMKDKKTISHPEDVVRFIHDFVNKVSKSKRTRRD